MLIGNTSIPTTIMTFLDINPPKVPEEEVFLQWDKICKHLSEAIESDVKVGNRYTILHYKVFDANRKRLEEKGFWTTNHITSCPVLHKHVYVTAVSWA